MDFVIVLDRMPYQSTLQISKINLTTTEHSTTKKTHYQIAKFIVMKTLKVFDQSVFNQNWIQ